MFTEDDLIRFKQEVLRDFHFHGKKQQEGDETSRAFHAGAYNALGRVLEELDWMMGED